MSSSSKSKKTMRIVRGVLTIIGAVVVLFNVWTLSNEMIHSVVKTVSHHHWMPNLAAK